MTVVSFIVGCVIAGYRIYSKFEDIPQRVQLLEENYSTCHARELDLEKLNSTIDRLSANMDNDYYNINALNDCQIAMMEGMLNMFQHFINGNHVKEMQSSYDSMVKALVKAQKVRNQDERVD